MNAFQFGKWVYEHNGLSRVAGIASRAVGREGLTHGASILAGGLTAGASGVLGPAVAVAGTLYGAKQIYDGIKGFSEG